MSDYVYQHTRYLTFCFVIVSSPGPGHCGIAYKWSYPTRSECLLRYDRRRDTHTPCSAAHRPQSSSCRYSFTNNTHNHKSVQNTEPVIHYSHTFEWNASLSGWILWMKLMCVCMNSLCLCVAGLVLVTDAVTAMGLPPGRHTLGQQQIDIQGLHAYVAGLHHIQPAFILCSR